MPFLDAYIPEGALTPDAERTRVAKITDLLIEHEGVDPANEKGRALAWVFVHRPQVYVAGAAPRSPRYRFICQVPEGQYTDQRRAAITAAITRAVGEAEAGAWAHHELRVGVFALEIPDGTWGGGGRIIRLPDIYELVWPLDPRTGGEPRETAERLLVERRRASAEKILAPPLRERGPGPRRSRRRGRHDDRDERPRTHVIKTGQVREVALPPDALALTTLSRVDYTDAFRLDAGRAQHRTGEEWARAMLEGAPAATRTRLRRGWFALGVRLGPANDDRRVLGWAVRRSSPEFAVLAASSLIGIEAEVVCKREPRGLLVATFMQLKNPVARTVWAVVSPRHRRVLRHLIQDVSRRR